MSWENNEYELNSPKKHSRPTSAKSAKSSANSIKRKASIIKNAKHMALRNITARQAAAAAGPRAKKAAAKGVVAAGLRWLHARRAAIRAARQRVEARAHTRGKNRIASQMSQTRKKAHRRPNAGN